MNNCKDTVLLFLCLLYTKCYSSFGKESHVKSAPLVNRLQFTTNEYDSPYEVIFISKKSHPKYEISAFGQNLTLLLELNQHLISPRFVSYVYDGESKEEIPSAKKCHYLHSDPTMSAAMDLCKHDKIFGFIFLEHGVFEIAPINGGTVTSQGYPHVIKLVQLVSNIWSKVVGFAKNRNHRLQTEDGNLELEVANDEHTPMENKRAAVKGPYLEVGLFLDEAGYNLFATYFKNDNAQLKDMLLAYLNGVQALYHHPTAGVKLDIVINNMEILKKQPSDLPHYSGERSSLLDSFCAFNEKHNPPKDDDLKHWDIGIYLSGLDFFSVDNGRRNNITMGLSAVGGICSAKYSCLIAELGTTNVLGKPYPSAGFTSVYVLAHEIGHNLGMHHDSSSNNCPKDGFIMSPSRGVAGETLWSTCSAQVLKQLSKTAKCLYEENKADSRFNHMKFKDKPGAVWGAKKQCEILLKDRDAKSRKTEKSEGVCQSLQCETKHRSGVFLAGPALEGTVCGKNKWCHGGECIQKRNKKYLKIESDLLK